MKKKLIVVILPTKKATLIFKDEDGELVYDKPSPSETFSKIVYSDVEYQHLYFISDEEIEKGDYVYQQNFEKTCQEIIKIETEAQCNIANLKEGSFNKLKVIATTDDTLICLKVWDDVTTIIKDGELRNPDAIKSLLPQIPESFIQNYVKDYNEGNLITEVQLEMEELYGYPEDIPERNKEFKIKISEYKKVIIVNIDMEIDFGIKVKMPFYHLGTKSNEVEINGKNLIYCEANNGYGLQVNDKKTEEEVKTLCFEISERVKKLQTLTNY